MKKIIFLFFAFFNLPVLALSDTKPHIAVGNYWDKNHQSYTFLAVEDIANKSWIFSPVTTGDVPEKEAWILHYSGCSAHSCVIAGSFQDFTHFTGISIDQGRTWKYSYPDMFDMHKIKCTQNLCFRYGSSKSAEGHYIPFIAVNDKYNWSYHNIITPKKSSYAIKDMSCTPQQCVAILGNYVSLTNPFIAVTFDQGASWIFPEISNLKNSKEINLDAISCYENTCVLGGNVNQNDHYTPLLLTSLDKGLSWRKSSIPDDVNKGYIYKIKCDETACIALGRGTSKKIPLLMVSHDSGKSWVYPRSILNVPESTRESRFESVGCQSNFCMAVGGYVANVECKTQPLLATSIDKGNTWSYRSLVLPSIPNARFCDDYGLAKVSCHERSCMATGTYFDGKKEMPLLIVTEDQGKNWSSHSKDILPEGSTAGSFSNIDD